MYITFAICLSLSSVNARLWNRLLSSVPHLAGTPQEKKNAEMLAEQWESFGFDNVQIISYDVLLAYPDEDYPNKVSFLGIFKKHHRLKMGKQ